MLHVYHTETQPNLPNRLESEPAVKRGIYARAHTHTHKHTHTHTTYTHHTYTHTTHTPHTNTTHIQTHHTHIHTIHIHTIHIHTNTYIHTPHIHTTHTHTHTHTPHTYIHTIHTHTHHKLDKLAKEAAMEDGSVVYDKIPREVLITRVKENGLNMWQQQWTNTGRGTVTKAFFPSVGNRLREKMPIFPEFTILVTGHGKLRSYLHKSGITDNPMCPCEEKEQTSDHLILQ